MNQGTRIVVKCPDCGEVRVAPAAVTVRSCIDDGAGSYWFMCPMCRVRAVGESGTAALMDAVDAGAAYETWARPAEVSERPGGAPFNLADVFELHLLLLEPDWFADFSRCAG